ncbi:MAG: hypothetical protein WA771_04120 [Chthoniobacterales bacterium]
MTLGGDLTLNSGSELVFSLGSPGLNSSIARTAGTFDFQPTQSIRFLDFGAAPGTYSGLLTGLASTVNVSGWTIANSGWTGSFFSDSNSVGFTLTAVPEPSTVVAAFLVFGALCWMRYRQVRTANARD